MKLLWGFFNFVMRGLTVPTLLTFRRESANLTHHVTLLNSHHVCSMRYLSILVYFLRLMEYATELLNTLISERDHLKSRWKSMNVVSG